MATRGQRCSIESIITSSPTDPSRQFQGDKGRGRGRRRGSMLGKYHNTLKAGIHIAFPRGIFKKIIPILIFVITFIAIIAHCYHICLLCFLQFFQKIFDETCILYLCENISNFSVCSNFQSSTTHCFFLEEGRTAKRWRGVKWKKWSSASSNIVKSTRAPIDINAMLHKYGSYIKVFA